MTHYVVICDLMMALGLCKDMVPTYIVHEDVLGLGKDMVPTYIVHEDLKVWS